MSASTRKGILFSGNNSYENYMCQAAISAHLLTYLGMKSPQKKPKPRDINIITIISYAPINPNMPEIIAVNSRINISQSSY